MLDKDISKTIETIKNINDNSSDIAVHETVIAKTKVSYVYLESTCSDDKISNFLGKSLSFDSKNKLVLKDLFNYLKNTIPNSKLKVVKTYDDVFYHLFSGFTCIFIDGFDECITVETKASLDRSISESSSEPVLKGPKDSFNENYHNNIGLIRKRIKDSNLVFKELKVGRRSKTKVSIAYIKDIADMKHVKSIYKKIEQIDIDGIIDSSYIRELITDNQSSFLPRVISTERPDMVSISLLDGKIAIIVENSPFVLLLPSVFADFFKTPEDQYIKPFNASVTRILRYMAFFIAILVPAFYIAITTYDVEIIPNLLLISFAIEKETVPFPTVVEVLILIIAYEILKEADTRKNQIMGASISIVGALILGEAAVSAGIISPIVVIIISLSAVAGMSFSNPDLVNAIRSWRIIFILSACLFGLVGIIFMFTIFIAKTSSLKVLGVPYFTPLAPFNKNDVLSSVIRLKQKSNKNRTTYLTDNLKRIGDE